MRMIDRACQLRLIKPGKMIRGFCVFFLIFSSARGALGYEAHLKGDYLTDIFLRNVVDRMSKDLAVAADGYLEIPESRAASNNIASSRAIKDMENEETSYPVDFENLSGNPSPSLRDQEYLQHSSLWGHQFVAGGAGEGKQRLKPDGSMKNQEQVKTDATLPAYCNPPNPCPVGFSSEDGCLEEFENTAAFSREFQASQDCMCDSEHMFDCPTREFQSGRSEISNDIDLDRIMDELSIGNQHKNLVAKKFHYKKNMNPYLAGERLPVAAKKGDNILSF